MYDFFNNVYNIIIKVGIPGGIGGIPDGIGGIPDGMGGIPGGMGGIPGMSVGIPGREVGIPGGIGGIPGGIIHMVHVVEIPELTKEIRFPDEIGQIRNKV